MNKPTEKIMQTIGMETMGHLAAIVSSSDDAIISKNLDSIITSWNYGAEKIFGYKAREAIGQSINILIPPELLISEEKLFKKVLHGKRISHYKTTRICKDGQIIDVSVSISPIFDHSGEVIGISKIARDISSQILEAEALIIANKKLKFEAREKAKRAAELLIANRELAFQMNEKAKRVDELTIANTEKANRAAELVIANEELAYQRDEKAKRVVELLIANKEKVKKAIELGQANKKLQTSFMETIELARQMVELRDPYTANHEKHVGDLAKAIAKQMCLSKDRQQGLLISGYLHDIGKITVPVEILSKPGRISDQEYDLVKNHVIVGYDLLKEVTFPWPVAQIVLEHHERLNGSGYPNQLGEDQISLEGRILAVADVVDAMSSHRPYRSARGIDLALAEINAGSGTLYDSAVVEACNKLFKTFGYKIDQSY